MDSTEKGGTKDGLKIDAATPDDSRCHNMRLSVSTCVCQYIKPVCLPVCLGPANRQHMHECTYTSNRNNACGATTSIYNVGESSLSISFEYILLSSNPQKYRFTFTHVFLADCTVVV